jgi:hypothetical protein
VEAHWPHDLLESCQVALHVEQGDGIERHHPYGVGKTAPCWPCRPPECGGAVRHPPTEEKTSATSWK